LLEAEHLTKAEVDRSVILFNQVVQLFRGPNCGPFAAMMLFDYGMARPSRHDPFREGMSCL
jgi:hypothetical protein